MAVSGCCLLSSIATVYAEEPERLYFNSCFKLCWKSHTRFIFHARNSISTSATTSHIFLPFLQDKEKKGKRNEANKLHKDVEDDPLLKFFSSRTATRDVEARGRLTLQKNRRTSWRVENFTSDPESDGESTTDEKEEAKEECGSSPSASTGPVKSISGEILRIAKELPENVGLGEMLGAYEGRISAKECTKVLKLLGEEGLSICCLHFFEWMRLQEPSLVTPWACSVLFPVLGRALKGKELLILFRNLPWTKEFMEVRVYNSAISGLFLSGRYDDALIVYEEMEINNVRPDHVTSSLMITFLRKMGRSAKDVWQFFERMNRKEVPWSVEVLGALTKSLCDEGLTSEAFILLSEMEEKGVSPNAVVYSTLMNAYSKSDRPEEAEAILIEMKAKGVLPNAATYNVLMDAYSRRMQPEVVEKLMLEMEDNGLVPDVQSYTCLISAYGRMKNVSDKAANAFLKMKRLGIKPTSHSYTALIHAFSVDGWYRKAYLAFENMQRQGIKPSVETYTALLDAYRRAGNVEMLLEIWNSMRRERIKGTRVTLNILLDGLAKQGRYAEARNVIFHFKKMGLQPTVFTYNILLNAYCRGGLHTDVPYLLQEMNGLNLRPDEKTYSTIIFAFIRVRDFRSAVFYHNIMVRTHGVLMNCDLYKKMRELLNEKVRVRNQRAWRNLNGLVRGTVCQLHRKRKFPKWKSRSKWPQYGAFK